jgi:hypothetical protein
MHDNDTSPVRRAYQRTIAKRGPQEPSERSPEVVAEGIEALNEMVGNANSDAQADSTSAADDSDPEKDWSGQLPWTSEHAFGTTGLLTGYQKGLLRTAHIALGSGITKERRQRIIHQAIGQRQRAQVATGTSMTGVGLGLGLHPNKVANELARIDLAGLTPLTMLPNRQDRALAAASPYPDADPPNPYLWVAVATALNWPKPIEKEQVSDPKPDGLNVFVPGTEDFTADPNANAQADEHQGPVIWEVGAAPAPSVEVLQHVRPVRVVMPRLLTQSGMLRLAVADPALELRNPFAVVVPLPLACDRYSRARWKNLWRTAGVEERPWWVEQSHTDHPEFAENIDSYMRTVRWRLRWVGSVVESGTQIVVTARDHLGVPHAVAKLICKKLRWQFQTEAHAYEPGGATHLGNGSPLGARWVSIWRTP